MPKFPNSVSHGVKKIILSAGIEGVSLHYLRHTHASLLLEAGVHPKAVQERLGHASISTTVDTYSHVLPGLQEAAAVALEERFSETLHLQIISKTGSEPDGDTA